MKSRAKRGRGREATCKGSRRPWAGPGGAGGIGRRWRWREGKEGEAWGCVEKKLHQITSLQGMRVPGWEA